ncbi:rho guanine nucleotide exchange factor 9-like [Hemitrygon akajei]|uniref:rho guanine nucleotide exchange factor 9-like n=1 Tax=Hemitrygon akajei TaxID=2704970 RepID=UPI003BF9FE3A
MHKRLLSSMETRYNSQQPHLSEFGACFIEQGDDLKLRSTELIHRGDLVVVSEPGARAKNYTAYLFDHQMILCKKDLIRRNVLYYKERIFLETCLVTEVNDGNDMEFDCKVKYAFKLRSKFFEERCRLMFAKSLADKQLWLHAFEEERNIASGNKVSDKNKDVDLGLEDSFYDLRSPNVSSVQQEQFSFLFQRKRRKSGYKFNPKIR